MKAMLMALFFGFLAGVIAKAIIGSLFVLTGVLFVGALFVSLYLFDKGFTWPR